MVKNKSKGANVRETSNKLKNICLFLVSECGTDIQQRGL